MAYKSQRWKSAKGVIISSERGSKSHSSISRSPSGPGQGSQSERSSSTIFFPKVKYAFKVDRKMYEGDRYWWQDGTSENEMEELLLKNKVGENIKVYFDPKDPANNVIDNTLPFSRFILIPLVLIFSILSLFSIIYIFLYNFGYIEDLL